MLVPQDTRQMALGDMGRSRAEPAKPVVPEVALGWSSPDTATVCHRELLEELGFSGVFSCSFPNVSLCVSLLKCSMSHAGLMEASGVC